MAGLWVEIREFASKKRQIDMRGVFISDLHLYSRRSIGQECWQSIQARVQDSECLVLGGDIFDFRWSEHRELERTLDAAGNWLDELAQKNPNRDVVYVLGNHDCHKPMQDLLTSLSGLHSNFSWHEYYFRQENKIFLHGDVLDAGANRHQLDGYRGRFASEDRSRGKIPNFLYDVMVGMRVHRLPGRWLHQAKRTVSRLGGYLANESMTLENGIDQIYFGHTHQPIRSRFGDQHFFNPGSGIRHLAFRPCFFEH